MINKLTKNFPGGNSVDT